MTKEEIELIAIVYAKSLRKFNADPRMAIYQRVMESISKEDAKAMMTLTSDIVVDCIDTTVELGIAKNENQRP